ncbi:MAG: glycosyltransferase family 2 protein [Candidatus Schekmanbacteria bacterium]|nr:glycosyltransferase family 2 protein [Candidatus Schekmanbacteria bacterium]
MPQFDLISVVIPAYNEAAGIGQTLDQLYQVMKTIGSPYEILVINDGSGDATAQIAAAKGAIVLNHPYNIGNGAAVKTGLRRAAGEVIILMDADGQHPVQVIPNLLQFIPQYDMVVGARSHSSQATLIRRWGNKAYNSLATYITGKKIEDLTSGFRVIKKPVAKKFIYLLPNGFSYPTTITLSLLKAGYSLKYVAIDAQKRQGKSKLNTSFEAARFFIIILRIATLFSPLKIFLPISVFSLTLGLAYGSYMIIVHSHFSNMVLLLMITALVVFLMGLIAEEIALLRIERSED